MLKGKKERKQVFIDLISSTQNLCEECNISVNTIEHSDGTYLQYDSDRDTHFKALSVEKYFEETKTHFIAICYNWRIKKCKILIENEPNSWNGFWQWKSCHKN